MDKDPDPETVAAKRAELDKALEFLGSNYFKDGNSAHIVNGELSTADTTLATALGNVIKYAQYEIKNENVKRFWNWWTSTPFHAQTHYGQ